MLCGVRRAAAMLCLLLASATYSTGALADDTVFLKNGGRVRGTVMEENPQTGVRIQLADGTVRQVAPSDVDRVEYGATAPPPQPPPPPGVPPPAAPITQPQTIGAGPGVPVTGDGGPMMLPPRKERRNKGAMIAGIVLLPVGFVAAAVGGAIAGVSKGDCVGDSHDCGHIVPILWGFGSAMMISGIVLVSIGAPEVSASSAALTLSPTPGGLSLQGAF